MFSPGMNLVVGSTLFMIIPFFVVPRYHPALLLTPGRLRHRLLPLALAVPPAVGAGHRSGALHLRRHEHAPLGGAGRRGDHEGRGPGGRRDRDLHHQRPQGPRLLRAPGRYRGPLPAHALARPGLCGRPLPRAATSSASGWWTPAASWPTSACCACSSSPPSPHPLRTPRSHPASRAHAASWSSSITRRTWTRTRAGRAATIRGEIEFRGVTFRYPVDAALSTTPGSSAARRGVRIRAGAGPQGHLLQRQAGPDRRHRRSDGLRQDQPRPADQPHLRRRGRPGARRWRGRARVESRRACAARSP